jgi:hypothetical protein
MPMTGRTMTEDAKVRKWQPGLVYLKAYTTLNSLLGDILQFHPFVRLKSIVKIKPFTIVEENAGASKAYTWQPLVNSIVTFLSARE